MLAGALLAFSLSGCNEGQYYGYWNNVPRVGATGADSVYAAGSNIEVPFIVWGKSSTPLTLRVYHVDDNQAVALFRSNLRNSAQSILGSWQPFMTSTSARWLPRTYAETVYAELGMLPPGMYGVLATFGGASAATMISVSRFALSGSRSGDMLMFAPIDTATGDLYGPRVTFKIDDGQGVRGSFPAAGGIGVDRLTAPCCPVVIASDGSSEVLSQPWELWGSRSVQPRGLYVHTDRPFYRVGDVLAFRALPGRPAERLGSEQVSLDCPGNVAQHQMLQFSAFGTLSGSFRIPITMRSGYCGLSVGSTRVFRPQCLGCHGLGLTVPLVQWAVMVLGRGNANSGVSVLPAPRDELLPPPHVESIPGPVSASNPCAKASYSVEVVPRRWWAYAHMPDAISISLTGRNHRTVADLPLRLTIAGERWNAQLRSYASFSTKALRQQRTDASGHAIFFWRPSEHGLYTVSLQVHGIVINGASVRVLVVNRRENEWFAGPGMIPRVIPDRFRVAPGGEVRFLVVAPRANARGFVVGGYGSLARAIQADGYLSEVDARVPRDASTFSMKAGFGNHNGVVYAISNVFVDPQPNELVVRAAAGSERGRVNIIVSDAWGRPVRADVSVSVDDAEQSAAIDDPPAHELYGRFRGTGLDLASNAGSFQASYTALWSSAASPMVPRPSSSPSPQQAYCSRWVERYGSARSPALLAPRLEDLPSGSVTQAAWIPSLLTDSRGHASVSVNQRGTWRVRALAVTRDGRAGLGEADITVSR